MKVGIKYWLFNVMFFKLNFMKYESIFWNKSLLIYYFIVCVFNVFGYGILKVDYILIVSWWV